jgi:hypothetical protein
MNGPTAEASAAVVIAKNPAKGQCLVNGIQLGVILTDYPPEQLPKKSYGGELPDFGRKG